MNDLPFTGAVARKFQYGGTFRPCDCGHLSAWSYDTQGQAKVCDKSVSCRHSVGLYMRHLVESGKTLQECIDTLLDPAHIGAKWVQHIEGAQELLAGWYQRSKLQIAGLLADPTQPLKKKFSKRWYFRPSITGWYKVLRFIDSSDIVGLDALHIACAAALGWRKSLVWDYLQEGRKRGYIAVEKVATQPGRRGRKPMVASVVAWPQVERKVITPECVNPVTGEVTPARLGSLTKKQMAVEFERIDPDNTMHFLDFARHFGADLEYQSRIEDYKSRVRAQRARFAKGKEKAPGERLQVLNRGPLTTQTTRHGWSSMGNITHIAPALQPFLRKFSEVSA